MYLLLFLFLHTFVSIYVYWGDHCSMGAKLKCSDLLSSGCYVWCTSKNLHNPKIGPIKRDLVVLTWRFMWKHFLVLQIYFEPFKLKFVHYFVICHSIAIKFLLKKTRNKPKLLRQHRVYKNRQIVPLNLFWLAPIFDMG